MKKQNYTQFRRIYQNLQKNHPDWSNERLGKATRNMLKQQRDKEVPLTTLEDFLHLFGSPKPFRKNPIECGDGCIDYLTKTGNRSYGYLTDFLYAVGELTECKTEIEKIVNVLDHIAESERA